MKKLLNTILNPGRWLLVFFALSITPFLLYVVLNATLSYSFSKIFYIFVYSLLAFSFAVTFLIDRYNKTRLKRYVILTFVMLTVFILLQICSKDYLTRKSEERGVELAEFIEKYKIEKGMYPNNLQDAFFDNAPKRSFLGTKFYINAHTLEYYQDTICYIEYGYFDGYIGACNTNEKKWHYYD